MTDEIREEPVTPEPEPEAHPPHPPEEAVVLCGRNLIRIPGALALLALPALAVRQLLGLAALALDGDRRLAHPNSIVRRIESV